MNTNIKEALHTIASSLLSLPLKDMKPLEKELNNLLSKVRGLKKLGKEQKADKGKEGECELLYTVITEGLREELKMTYPPFSIFRKGKGYKKAQQAVEFLGEFLETVMSGGVDKVVRVKVYKLYYREISKYLKERDVLLCPNIMLACHKRFPSLIEKHYPSYIQAGWFWIILER